MEKIRRVRVAALTVEDEGCKASLLGESPAEEGEVCAVDFSCGILRERRVETKVGRAILGKNREGRKSWGVMGGRPQKM